MTHIQDARAARFSPDDEIKYTTEDLLDFWAKAVPSLHVHPDDAAELAANHHALTTEAFVGPYMGPVRTAPVVLLTLNGGISDNSECITAPKVPGAREAMADILSGDAPLPEWIGDPTGRVWTTRRLAQFGLSYDAAAPKVAFINLIGYRSKHGANDMHMAKRLESSRMVRKWAHSTLFPEAREGKRVVVCLRSARAWGLEPGTKQGAALFAPRVNRAGYIHLDVREEVGAAVRRAVFSSIGAPCGQ
jgi:hypothetical protein